VLFTGQTGLETDIPTLVAVVLGALTAGSVHGARASVRPAATTATAGMGNSVLSLAEDAGSALLTLTAFALPLLAFLLVLALVAGLAAAWRRARTAGRRRAPG
jgi:hypothetical protein